MSFCMPLDRYLYRPAETSCRGLRLAIPSSFVSLRSLHQGLVSPSFTTEESLSVDTSTETSVP